MATKKTSALIIIGGHEDKTGEKAILGEVARRVGPGKLVVTTVASEQPAGAFEEYERVFRGLGLRHVYKLEIESRGEATEGGKVRILDEAAALFFTGGDQLKITSRLGDTPIFRRIQQIYEEGGVIAGTSAGAAVMCETMLVGGGAEQSHKVKDTLRMAPGLGLIEGVVIDQHFAERGRMGRLLAAIAQNPKNLGIGIDENTAVVVEGGKSFYVLGDGAVYVVDGAGVPHSNIGEEEADHTMSIYDVKLHLLSQGDGYDLIGRRPGPLPPRAAARLPKEAEEPEKAGSRETGNNENR